MITGNRMNKGEKGTQIAPAKSSIFCQNPIFRNRIKIFTCEREGEVEGEDRRMKDGR